MYELGLKHALENITTHGGKVAGDKVYIKDQKPMPVPFEQSFQQTYPIKKDYLGKVIEDTLSYAFEGTGIVVKGYVSNWDGKGPKYVAQVEYQLDGHTLEPVDLPADFIERRHELYWKYNLKKGHHVLKIKLLNRVPQYDVRISDILIYSDTQAPIENVYQFGRIPKK